MVDAEAEVRGRLYVKTNSFLLTENDALIGTKERSVVLVGYITILTMVDYAA
jgi:hypothetical protein